MLKQSLRVLNAMTTCAMASLAAAAIPNHPVITEVFADPPGLNDGPVARQAGNPHQEFIEIYLPPAANLSASLNKDALRMTIYEVEGDEDSSGPGLVNYRFDLPTFDLDSSNGITAGAVARPPSGVVVIGWVDYVGNPPTALAGTASTRVAMVNGGVTSTSNYTFVAINGNQFGGTTNFPTVAAESLIDLPSETQSGIIQNGSGVYLLVNRDAAGYVQLYDDQHVPVGGSADPALETNLVLNTTCLLDAFGCNDSSRFDVLDQPSADNNNDNATNLPPGGAFSLLVCQIPEDGKGLPYPSLNNGYARKFVDVAKTTETAAADDPITDSLNAYLGVRNDGPFVPTPGFAALSTSSPRLGVVSGAEAAFSVLAGTTGRPALLCANIGGNFGVNMSASTGASSNPPAATFAGGAAVSNVQGQQFGLPTIEISSPIGAANAAVATASATVTGTNTVGGQPAVVNPVQAVTVTATVLNPTQGQNAAGAPLEATVFVAIQPVVASAATNEFAATSLAAFIAANNGGLAQDWHAHSADLINPITDLASATVTPLWKESFPGTTAEYINPVGPPGNLDLVQTVLNSAEVLSGGTTYELAFNATNTAVRAIRVNTPDTITFGGAFTPTEHVYFADAIGEAGNVRSGLSDATTTRGFEVALIDTNVRADGSVESGATDDVGVIVEALEVEPGSPVVPGQFIFLSFTGGKQGADIDSLDVKPGATVLANVIYFDLDNLHTVLGVKTIEQFWLVDAAAETSECDIIDAISLNPVGVNACLPCDIDCNGTVNPFDIQPFIAALSGTGTACSPCAGDANGDGTVNPFDINPFISCLAP